MSVNRRDIIRYFERYGFFLKREGGNHSIYSNGKGISVAIGRHNIFHRVEANRLCREAGLPKAF